MKDINLKIINYLGDVMYVGQEIKGQREAIRQDY